MARLWVDALPSRRVMAETQGRLENLVGGMRYSRLRVQKRNDRAFHRLFDPEAALHRTHHHIVGPKQNRSCVLNESSRFIFRDPKKQEVIRLASRNEKSLGRPAHIGVG